MWTWKCSVCPEVFMGDTAEEAEKLFLTHAQDVHKAKVILSINSEK